MTGFLTKYSECDLEHETRNATRTMKRDNIIFLKDFQKRVLALHLYMLVSLSVYSDF